MEITMRTSTTFKPGQGGRTKGARQRLQFAFVEALQEHFVERGKDAIEICFKEDPTSYLKIIASVLPKEFVVESGLADLDDEQIDELLMQLRQRAIEAREAQQLPMQSLKAIEHEPTS